MTTKNQPYFFVLGAPDHEMQEIERVCKEEHIPYAYATVKGYMAHSYDAYKADGVSTKTVPPGAKVVFVECAVLGLRCDDIIDHHQEGDPGFGKPPQEFYSGSSLGQFLTLIGKEPTQRQRVIAAADHCLTAAYQGLCPDITPEEVKAFREATRSKARSLPTSELQRQIDEATKQLQAAPKVEVAGVPVAWFESEPPNETSEASARIAMPYMYVRKQEDGRMKAGIRSAPAKVVDFWIRNCGLGNVYGDPQRGFAGGYYST